MAHYVKPPGTKSDGYDVDNKLAPGSIWRVRFSQGESLDVALWGGAGLWVRSNNPGVVPNDGFGERPRGDLRLLTLSGAKAGTSMLETGQGGSTWVSVQVQVAPAADADPTPNAPKLIPHPENVIPFLSAKSFLDIGGIWGHVSAGQTCLCTDGSRFIFSADNMMVVFYQDGKFYSQTAGGFRNDVRTFPAVEGGRRSLWMAKVAEVEMKLLMGIVAGASGVGFAVVIGTEILEFIAENEENFAKWQSQYNAFMQARAIFKSVAPTLYDKVFDAALKQIYKDAKAKIPDSITAETVAFGVGVVIGAAGKKAAQGRFSILAIAFVVLEQIVIRMGLNVAPTAITLTLDAYGKLANDIISKMKDAGVTVQDMDVKKIVEEVTKHPQEVKKAFDMLQDEFSKK